jgi:glyoxylate reductase
MNSSDESRPRVAIARVLLEPAAGALRERFEVVEGGVGAGREEVLALVPGASALVADPTVPVDAGLLDAAGPELKVVANFAVGYDNVDLGACRERGVIVTNTPGVLTNATAELALALTMAAARQLPAAERRLRAGEWTGWDPGADLELELGGATFGIVGMGRIGRRYAELVRPLAGELLYASPSPKPDAEDELKATRVELEDLLGRADVVSLHAPATAETRHLVDARALELMRPRAVLVNTSRGSLVDAAALAEALREDRIGAAGLDVYETEPAVPAELLDAPRLVLLPHIGSATTAAREAMAQLVAENVIAVLEGRDPPNPVETG